MEDDKVDNTVGANQAREPVRRLPGEDQSSFRDRADGIEFQAVIDHFKQDLREFFIRSNFYLVVQGTLFSAFVLRKTPASTFEYLISSGIILVGLVLASFWSRVSKSSLFFIKRWRREVCDLSYKLTSTQSYYRVEAKEHTDSPEAITGLLPHLFAWSWLAIWLLITLHRLMIP